jgi:hypothetical protein
MQRREAQKKGGGGHTHIIFVCSEYLNERSGINLSSIFSCNSENRCWKHLSVAVILLTEHGKGISELERFIRSLITQP